MIPALFSLLDLLISIYVWAFIASAVISLLLAFGVLDRRNQIVWSIADFLGRVTDPVLRPIRRVLPNFGTIDVSPMIAIALLQIVVRPLLGAIYRAILTGSLQPLFFG